MLKKLFNYLKKEVQLTKEYYQGQKSSVSPFASDNRNAIDKMPPIISSHNTSFVYEKKITEEIYKTAKLFDTDLVIMSVHGASCSECAKYQGRVFSLTGSDKLFPRLPSCISLYGGVHPGCGHTFSTYIHGVNDPMLKYTLSIQNNVKPQYRKNIVAFSNRPFIDDRLPEDIIKAEEYNAKLKAEQAQRVYFEMHRAEIEARWAADKRDYQWLQKYLPDICPKSYSGYKRMKNGNTKNYQKLIARARELGRDIK